MNEPLNGSGERELRVGGRVSLGDRVGVLRYVRGAAAVVRFDHEPGTRVVPLSRLVAHTDECPTRTGGAS
jgi:hypothetical protein